METEQYIFGIGRLAVSGGTFKTTAETGGLEGVYVEISKTKEQFIPGADLSTEDNLEVFDTTNLIFPTEESVDQLIRLLNKLKLKFDGIKN
jgi:hypothetical protein